MEIIEISTTQGSVWASTPAPPMQISSQCPAYSKHPKQTGVDIQLTDLAGLRNWDVNFNNTLENMLMEKISILMI